ncbi:MULTISPECIES: SIS domain-containing protein [unclassified Pseudomonas]|uniref:SIS domain-containing protein n=3 Tax=Pseudomonas TaxID=286 RepID=UPI002B22DDEF|nr:MULTISPECIES: SIS domain-containing protein [unclassified Pseudomonas]MEA9975661.1 SIS domain-containing protein [Pseudomonas sp. RTS4]MEA9996733.1 SIS domain-containing protein [Pseudomonas sp. AA4]MEB0085467.1 SIS domain-containing protein [Pseudomonas sp. RTI1]MEB0124529.1 SIS domain-containing protein [Pseudomonas sp. CCC1.2]MEB0152324.1 SIS domain-containing protein [Pseudomonas sp. CCC4.3]
MPFTASPYELDIDDQIAALDDQLAYKLPSALAELDLKAYDRIILTGMGSSDYTALPIERDLAARGYPVWRIDAGRLLDVPQLITSRTLLWATSQSGMSGEIVTLLSQLTGTKRPKTIIGVTNAENSTLAQACDILVALKSGSEATVSSKSYINTLVAQYRISLALRGESEAPLLATLSGFREKMATLVNDRQCVQQLTDEAFNNAQPRLALVGIGADGATAMTGALILKEACKVMAEGYLGGEFRHGPLETSGPGMIALLIGEGTDSTLENLAQDLIANGTTVVTIGPKAYAQSQLLPTDEQEEVVRLIAGILYVQHFTVTIARARGLVPGEFLYGNKITVKL